LLYSADRVVAIKTAKYEKHKYGYLSKIFKEIRQFVLKIKGYFQKEHEYML